MQSSMKEGPAGAALLASVILAGLLAGAGCGRERTSARDETPTGASPSPPLPAIPEELSPLIDIRKEDLDRLVERRKVRLLVTYGVTSYFVDRGSQGGWSFEAGRLLEQELNRRFRPGSRLIHVVFVPVTRDQLLPALLEGRGDVAMANLTITPARAAQVAFTTPLFSEAREVVVTAPGAPPLREADDLSGREVFVRASSSYAESLAELDRGLRNRGRPPLRVVQVDERLEDEDILEMVDAGLLPATVVDDYVARLWAEVLTGMKVHDDMALRTGGRIAWAVRPEDTKLHAFVDDFARRHRVGTRLGNVVRNRYLRNADRLRNPVTEEGLARFHELKGLFREYAERYGFDYLMLMALAYRESGLDQSRRSRAGAVASCSAAGHRGRPPRGHPRHPPAREQHPRRDPLPAGPARPAPAGRRPGADRAAPLRHRLLQRGIQPHRAGAERGGEARLRPSRWLARWKSRPRATSAARRHSTWPTSSSTTWPIAWWRSGRSRARAREAQGAR